MGDRQCGPPPAAAVGGVAAAMEVEGGDGGAAGAGAGASSSSSDAGAGAGGEDSAEQPKMNYNMNMAHPLCSTSQYVGMVERLKEMWKTQQHEMEGLDINNKSDFKHYNDLPLARIKRIMKSDTDAGAHLGPPTNLSILCAKESDAKTRRRSGPHWRAV